MSVWKIIYTPEAEVELLGFDKSVRMQIQKAIEKVSGNPLPDTEGGYGKPLGTKSGTRLTGCLKIKLLRLGIRIVYRLRRTERGMEILVIGVRADDEVYKIAVERLKNMVD